MSSAISKLRRKFGRGISSKKEIRNQNIVNQLRINELASNSNYHNPIGKTVNIIGAGFSGLFCAWILGHAGFTVNIYEGRDRIGGRVLTKHENGRLIEAGGELIGLCHPLWLHLAKKFGLSLNALVSEEDYEGIGYEIPIVIDGQILSHDEVEKAESSLDEILMRVSTEAQKIKYPSQPWKESEEIKKLDYVSVKDKLDEWKIEGFGRRLFEMQQESDNGSYCANQSYLGLLCQVKVRENFDPKNFWDTVEVFRCSNGNQSLASELAKAKNVTIHLNHLVKEVNLKDNQIELSIKSDKSEKEFTERSDYVVVTVPPSTFDTIIFQPELDLKKYSPAMGIAKKVISNVKSRFWINENLSPNAMSTNFGNVWEPTENQNILSLENQNIYLSAFLGDPDAPKDSGPEFDLKMNKLFRNSYTQNVLTKELVDWPLDPLTKAGYSYAGIGKSIDIGKNLYYPISEYENKLFFAGEHTHMSLYGYMEGALESGLRTARQIIESYNSQENNNDNVLRTNKILEIINY